MRFAQITKGFDPEHLDSKRKHKKGNPTYRHSAISSYALVESKALTFHVLDGNGLAKLQQKIEENWSAFRSINSGDPDDMLINNSLGLQYLLRATQWGFSASSEYLDLSMFVTEAYIDPLLESVTGSPITFAEWLGEDIVDPVPECVFYITRTLKSKIKSGELSRKKVDFDRFIQLTHEQGFQLLKDTQSFWNN